jgi:hypothetical protein
MFITKFGLGRLRVTMVVKIAVNLLKRNNNAIKGYNFIKIASEMKKMTPLVYKYIEFSPY